MSRSHTLTLTLGLTLAVASAAFAADAATHCASAADAATIRTAFAKPKPPAPFAAAAELKMPEAKVVSALPASQAHGVAASHFQAIWQSLRTWDASVFVVMKGGHVFEVYGKVFEGEPSKRSNYFNVHGEGAGMSGHLRPDLLSAIYLIALPSGEGTMRGVMFYDKNGEGSFGVYIPSEGATPSPALLKQFENTAAEIRALPVLCAKG